MLFVNATIGLSENLFLVKKVLDQFQKLVREILASYLKIFSSKHVLLIMQV